MDFSWAHGAGHYDLRPLTGLVQNPHQVEIRSPKFGKGIATIFRLRVDTCHLLSQLCFAEHQVVEKFFCCFQGRRLAWSHDFIDLNQRLFAVARLINRGSVANIGANINVIDCERGEVDAARSIKDL